MPPKRDSYFLLLAGAIAATVFTGFWFTYFGPLISGTRAGSPPVLHLHGWTFYLWYLLLVAQSALARSRRMSLHVTLGLASIALALLMVGTGLVVIGVQMDVALEKQDPFWTASGPTVFATLALFAGFYVAALRMRRRPDWHKRLILVASVGGMGAATFRLAMVIFGPEHAVPIGVLGSNVFILAGMARDRLRERRVHPAWWLGLLVCLGVEAGVLLLTPTAAGEAFARGLAAMGRMVAFLY